MTDTTAEATMSADTKAALDVAIAAHFTEITDGGFLTGYVLQVKGKTSDDLADGGQTSYVREVAESQDADVTLGLLDYGHTRFRSALDQWPIDDE